MSRMAAAVCRPGLNAVVVLWIRYVAVLSISTIHVMYIAKFSTGSSRSRVFLRTRTYWSGGYDTSFSDHPPSRISDPRRIFVTFFSV